MHNNTKAKILYSMGYLIKIGLLCIIYYVSLAVSYSFSIHSNYEHLGYRLEPDYFKLFEGIILCLLLHLTLLKSIRRWITDSVILLIFLGFIPLSVYFGMANLEREWLYLNFAFWCIVGLLLRFSVSLRNLSFKIQLPRETAFAFCSAVLSVYAVWINLRGGFGSVQELEDVYMLREVYASSSSSLGQYLDNWLAKAIVPFMIIYALNFFSLKNQILVIILISTFQVQLFLITGHKTFIAIIPICIGLKLLSWNHQTLHRLILVCIMFICIGTLLNIYFDNFWINDLFIRRLLFGPPLLSYFYYDFFYESPLLLSASRLGGILFDYPYSLAPQNLIGLEYFGNSNISANTGVVADAFMNFGYVGILVWAIAMAMILKIFESISVGKPVALTFPLASLALITFLEGFLLTSLLTHGVFLAFILILLSPDEQKSGNYVS